MTHTEFTATMALAPVVVDPDRLYSVEDSQTFLGGVSKTALYGLVNSGFLTPIKIGRKTCFSRRELLAVAQTGASSMTKEKLREITQKANTASQAVRRVGKTASAESASRTEKAA